MTKDFIFIVDDNSTLWMVPKNYEELSFDLFLWSNLEGEYHVTRSAVTPMHLAMSKRVNVGTATDTGGASYKLRTLFTDDISGLSRGDTVRLIRSLTYLQEAFWENG